MKLRKLKRLFFRISTILTLKAARAKSIRNFMQMVRPQTSNHPLIRVGGPADGGYLIPNDLEGVKVCFSPGVADRSEFEQDFANRGIRSYMADYSVDGPALKNPLFHFEKKYLGIENDDLYTTLESWITRNAPNESDMVLQMDIENSEYAVLEATSRQTLRKFRVMVIEFHVLKKLRNPKQLRRISTLFKKLLKDFVIVHIHPNNAGHAFKYHGLEIPHVMEFTFLRKDRITSSHPTIAFPHPLDRANVNNSAAIDLPDCWFRD